MGRASSSSWDSTPRTQRAQSRTSREWDTPARRERDISQEGTRYPEEASLRGGREWEEEQLRLDRDWYNDDADETGGNPFAGYEEAEAAEAATVSNLQQEAQTSGRRRMSARAAAYQADNDMWEVNRLAQSGVTGERRKFDLDQLAMDEEESRVHLLVHDLKPPFLDGRVVFTKQLEPINPVKDPTSDLAVFSKKGSALVRERRAQAERERASRKVAQLGGTSLGNLLGVKEEPEGRCLFEILQRINF